MAMSLIGSTRASRAGEMAVMERCARTRLLGEERWHDGLRWCSRGGAAKVERWLGFHGVVRRGSADAFEEEGQRRRIKEVAP
jgi:hypothetical protein